MRNYLPVIFQGSGGTDIYIVDTPVLFYFTSGDTPTIGIYRGGSPSSPPVGDCALSGYRVLLP